MSLATSALKRPITTVAFTLGLVLFGLVSLRQMPVTLLPDIGLPVLTIRTAYPGAAAEEVSRFVAEPIEKAVGGVPSLTEVRSVSRNGEATTTLSFAWGTDMPRTVLRVRELLDNARNTGLPQDAKRPTLLTNDPGERPIAMLAISGDGELRAIAAEARDIFSRRLEQIPGVAGVAVVGDPGDEIRVDLDPDRARALGITPEELRSAINSGNVMASTGYILRGQFRFPVRPLTELRDPGEILEIPIAIGNTRIRLGDVATVTPASADPQTVVRLDGHPAVGLVIYKDAGSNTVAVTRLLMQSIEQLRTEFSKVQLKVVSSQATFVENALSNLWQEILAGGVLSIVLILVCMRDWRMAVAIGIMVPLSTFVSLTLLQLCHVTINILSLGGLALAVGMLVDNAIVVAEATVRIRDTGLTPWEAARMAAEEISGPLIAGTLTTVLVFGPIIFVQGLAAALFRDLSLAVVVTLSASLILALTLMPVLTTWGHKRNAVGAARVNTNSIIDRGGAVFVRWYEGGMRWSLRHPAMVIGISVAITAVTVMIMVQLPREILPQVDEGSAVVSMQLPPGTAIEETMKQSASLEAAAKSLGSEGVYARVGFSTDEEVLAGADPGSEGSAMLVLPTPKGMNSKEFAEQLRKKLPALGGGKLTIDLAGQSEFGSLIGRAGRLVQVEVSGRTLTEAQDAAETVRKALDTLPMLRDVGNAYSETQPAVEISLERTRLVQYGISIATVQGALQGALGGADAQPLRETDRHTPIRIRYTGMANENLSMALSSRVGPARIPVSELVDVKEIRSAVAVVRVNQRPVTIISGQVEEGGTRKATKATLSAVKSLQLPAGTTWQVSGADAEQRRTTKELTIVAVLSVALMFLVLAGEFGSFSTPLIVMTTVPLAGAGGIIALWVMGQSINAVSLIGIIVMIGLADNEAVVKLDAIRRFREDGHSIDDAIVHGGHQRLRAIAMTSLTTITGVLPLVFNWGSGGELYQPLAAGIIGGSVTALLVTFFLLPTVYAMAERYKERRAGVSTA